MFNSINSAYGGGIRPSALQNANGSSALSKANNAQKAQKPDASQQAVKQAVKQPPVDKTALQDAVKKLNETVAPALQTVEFEIDEETDKTVVKVIDKESKEVIRQMPNEEALAFSKTLDKLQGLVIRQTA